MLSITAGAPSASATEVLGEPTNDLDIETLTSLEDVLDGWAGTLLVVSHDRYLLERVADRQVALLGDGQIRELPGGVDQYLQLRAEARQASASGRPWTAAAASGPAAAAASGPETAVASGPAVAAAASTDRARGSGGGASAAQRREARKEMARIERQLSRLAAEEERLHKEMVANAAEHASVLRLNDSLRALVDEREDLELAWLAAAEVDG